jgi:uncharacterized protein YoxC
MSNKKSLTEGIVDKVLQLLIKGKVKKVAKVFQNDPELVKAVKDLQDAKKGLKDKLDKWEKKQKKQLNKPLHKL